MFVLVESSRLKKMERRIMAKIDEYIASQNASMEVLGSAITGLASDISDLDTSVADLKAQLANGNLTPDQEAAVQAVTDKLKAVADRATALDALHSAAPPPPPVEEPPVEPQG